MGVFVGRSRDLLAPPPPLELMIPAMFSTSIRFIVAGANFHRYPAAWVLM